MWALATSWIHNMDQVMYKYGLSDVKTYLEKRLARNSIQGKMLTFSNGSTVLLFL